MKQNTPVLLRELAKGEKFYLAMQPKRKALIYEVGDRVPVIGKVKCMNVFTGNIYLHAPTRKVVRIRD